ncbi:MAG: hypothetical protein PVJ57_01070 [Phycisphaerae bacterium]|jgi:hypothetical protein
MSASYWVQLVIWLLAGAGGLLLVRFGWRRRVRSASLFCQRCGYDLRGTDSPRCSECGADLTKPGAAAMYRRKRAILVCLFGTVVAVGAWGVVLMNLFAGPGPSYWIGIVPTSILLHLKQGYLSRDAKWELIRRFEAGELDSETERTMLTPALDELERSTFTVAMEPLAMVEAALARGVDDPAVAARITEAACILACSSANAASADGTVRLCVTLCARWGIPGQTYELENVSIVWHGRELCHARDISRLQPMFDCGSVQSTLEFPASHELRTALADATSRPVLRADLRLVPTQRWWDEPAADSRPSEERPPVHRWHVETVIPLAP